MKLWFKAWRNLPGTLLLAYEREILWFVIGVIAILVLLVKASNW